MTGLKYFEQAGPEWLQHFLSDQSQPLESPEQRMALAIHLARENIQQGTGGPFGALVVDQRNSIPVSAGVNLVTTLGLSIAHAEVLALSIAQQRLGSWDLSLAGDFQLVTSCEPCAMCYGAIPWSGVSSLVCGAAGSDAEAVGFDEGQKPRHWIDALESRGIQVTTGVSAAAAAEVLRDYQASGQPIYNAGAKNRGE